MIPEIYVWEFHSRAKEFVDERKLTPIQLDVAVENVSASLNLCLDFSFFPYSTIPKAFIVRTLKAEIKVGHKFLQFGSSVVML